MTVNEAAVYVESTGFRSVAKTRQIHEFRELGGYALLTFSTGK